MLGLPKTTELNKPLAKKALFEKFKPTTADRKRFDEQISRLAIVAEISPQTVNLAASEAVSAVYVIAVALKTSDCDQKNIALLAKLIDQRLVFVLQYGDHARLGLYRKGKVLMSEDQPIDAWQLKLSGLDLGDAWDHLAAQIARIDLTSEQDLDAIIAENDRRQKLIDQIAALERKARAEQQPRRKWEYAEEIQRLKRVLGGHAHE